MDRAEVAVIGAGPAGTAAALCLARQGVDALLVEQSSGDEFRIGESLPPAARPVLESLGLDSDISECGHLRCFGNRTAWGSSELVSTDFIFQPWGHGWHLDRAAFDRMLLAAASRAGARVLRRTRFATAQVDDGGWTLNLLREDHAEQWRASLVIDASGRRAAFARGRGSRRLCRDRLIAVVVVLETSLEGDQDGTTLVEAVPDGWWYTALLPDGTRIAAYFTDGDLLDIPSARSSQGWRSVVERTEHIRPLCATRGYALRRGPLIVFAGSSRLLPLAGDGWCAAGDAAATLDPLSSQGILTALLGGQRAALWAAAALAGHHSNLADYGEQLEALYARYHAEYLWHYGREQRWPRSVFWRRRASTADR